MLLLRGAEVRAAMQWRSKGEKAHGRLAIRAGVNAHKRRPSREREAAPFNHRAAFSQRNIEALAEAARCLGAEITP